MSAGSGRRETVAVSCAGLTKHFGTLTAIEDVTLEVRSGEIVALLGPSGCGKTTFLRLVAGFERPDAGVVIIGNRTVVSDGTFVAAEHRRVGFVFQDYALFGHLTVSANVGFGVERRARPGRVADALEMVGLSGHGARYPHELSGGEQQRVALARAMAARPAIVLLDEPFSNLDADLRVRVRADVRRILRDVNATAVFVTHDQEEAFDIGDRIAVLNRGRIEQLGTPEEIYHLPLSRFVADFVGEAEFLPAHITGSHVETELGALPLPAHTDPGEAEIMVRPEDVILGETASACQGIVVSRRFRGPVVYSSVRLPSGRTVTSAHASRTTFPLGDRVGVRFAPQNPVLFRGQNRAL